MCTSVRFLGLIALAGTLLGPLACQRDPSPATTQPVGPRKQLVILTPHSEDIRTTFAAGFARWYLANRAAPVYIEWIYRGTPQCVQYVRDLAANRGEGATGPVPDLMFGGGISDHAALAADGWSRPLALPEDARVPTEVHGLPTRDSQHRWHATGLSSFGLVFNERAAAARGIAPPATWGDLADPRFYGWVAIADPRSSGSHRECLTIIVQRHGWPEAWSLILRTLANTRALNSRSGEALRQVESGVSLVTYAVNFDGQALAAQNAGALRYLDPPAATAVTPDVISVLRTASDPELAADFVRYVLSDEGQSLWGVPREHRTALGATTYHYPIVPTLYETHAGRLAVARNPLTEDFGVKLDLSRAARQAAALRVLVPAAAAGDNGLRLQQLWRRVIDAGLPAAAVAALTAPPLDEAGLAALAEQVDSGTEAEEAALADWTARFAKLYADVAASLGPG